MSSISYDSSGYDYQYCSNRMIMQAFELHLNSNWHGSGMVPISWSQVGLTGFNMQSLPKMVRSTLLWRRAGGLFGRIRDETSHLEVFIAILLWYLMMCLQLVASQSTQFELIGWILSYASLRLWHLPITVCNTFEVLMTRLRIFSNFLQPGSQKLRDAENAITEWKNRAMHLLSSSWTIVRRQRRVLRTPPRPDFEERVPQVKHSQWAQSGTRKKVNEAKGEGDVRELAMAKPAEAHFSKSWSDAAV